MTILRKIPRSSHNQWSMVEGNTNQIVKSTNHSCLTWIVKKFRIINSNLDIVPYFPARMRTIWIKSNHGNHPHEHTRVNNKNKKQRKHTVNLHQLQSHNSTSIVWQPCPLYLIPNFSLFGVQLNTHSYSCCVNSEGHMPTSFAILVWNNKSRHGSVFPHNPRICSQKTIINGKNLPYNLWVTSSWSVYARECNPQKTTNFWEKRLKHLKWHVNTQFSQTPNFFWEFEFPGRL